MIMNIIIKEMCHRAKLKKCLFGIAYPGFHLVGRSVGIYLFFLIFTIYTWTEMVKKKKKIKKSQIIFFLAAKQVSPSAMPNKQFFIFGLDLYIDQCFA